MISDKSIELAVERSLISADQAEGLYSIERGSAGISLLEPDDDEKLRFVIGFADIFVTLGIVLFLGALAYLMDQGAGSTPMLAGLAACAWLLAEFFTAKRRMALPSIVLLIVFVSAVLLLSLQIFGSLLHAPQSLSSRFWFLPTPNPAALAASSVTTVILAAMHYIHFRVPITIAAAAAALCLLAIGIVATLVPSLSDTTVNVVLFVCGVLVFTLAMRFDISDPARDTRRTDIAFWLHLLAAPLIVHPLIRAVTDNFKGAASTASALGILWIFLLLGVVAVIIDRRAVLVSGLIYAGVASGVLVKASGLAGGYRVPIVLLALGAFILLVSAAWQPLRRAILRRLPEAFARRLPHPLVSSTT